MLLLTPTRLEYELEELVAGYLLKIRTAKSIGANPAGKESP
jgi:hypothetical protein